VAPEMGEHLGLPGHEVPMAEADSHRGGDRHGGKW
jgi:hypothetical protein